MHIAWDNDGMTFVTFYNLFKKLHGFPWFKSAIMWEAPQ